MNSSLIGPTSIPTSTVMKKPPAGSLPKIAMKVSSMDTSPIVNNNTKNSFTKYTKTL